MAILCPSPTRQTDADNSQQGDSATVRFCTQQSPREDDPRYLDVAPATDVSACVSTLLHSERLNWEEVSTLLCTS